VSTATPWPTESYATESWPTGGNADTPAGGDWTTPLHDRSATLVDLLDSILDMGAVVSGDILLSVAGVDLAWLGLRAILSSVETARPTPAGSRQVSSSATSERRLWPGGRKTAAPGSRHSSHRDMPAPAPAPVRGEAAGLPAAAAETGLPAQRLEVDQNNVERGLLQLVLAIVDVVREVLERQAVRRMASGGLSEEEVERLGTALHELYEQMEQLKERFGLRDEDLRLDLGPIGALA
jgi:hypothetical protein